MSTVKFLCDEDVREALVAGLLRVDPAIEITAVSEEGAPPKGTLDPEVLIWAENNGYALISRDRSTLNGHIADHLAAGHHTWGVFLVRETRPWHEIIEILVLIWSDS
jgi:hypothetical protein